MKQTEREAEKLRRAIGQRRSRRGPLSRALRERGTRYAQARVAEGVAAEVIAAELGLAERTIERWLGGRGALCAAGASTVPVRVVDLTYPLLEAAWSTRAQP